MPFTSLFDGGLSVKIGGTTWSNGTERRGDVHGLVWDSTLNGSGAASFWLDVADPFDPQGAYRPDPNNPGPGYYKELRRGARVSISHTVDSATTYLYKGWVVSDPRAGSAGEKSIVQVECGGVAEMAKYRSDLAFTWTDCDTGSCWLINKRNNRIFSVAADDCLEIQVEDGEKVPNNKLGIVGYVPYLGAPYMMPTRNGVKRMEGDISTNLGDDMRAVLIYPKSGQYTDSRLLSDYTVIKTWGDAASEQRLGNAHFDTSSFWTPPSDGVKYLALGMYCTNAQGATMTKDRYVRIDNVRVYTGLNTRRVDEAMLEVANLLGFHDTADTATIGSVIPNLLVRPYTDGVSAINQLATQSDTLVTWGWWPNSSGGIVFRARPMRTEWSDIRSQSNCYKINPTLPGIDWDVANHPEDGLGSPSAVRLVYGRVGRTSDFPGGTPATQIGPTNLGLASGRPFRGAAAPVMTVDFSRRNFTDRHAALLANKLARSLALGSATGVVTLRVPTITVYASGAAKPCAYIQGGDWVDTDYARTGPLVVTRSTVDVDGGTVELEVGLPADILIEQLEAAGGITRVKLHQRHRYRRHHPT
jgi:hypothetical protein